MSSTPLRLCFVSVNASRVLLGATSGFGGAEVELVNVLEELARRPEVQLSLVTVSETENGFPQAGYRVFPVRPTPSDIGHHGFLARKLMVLAYWRRFARSLWYTGAQAYFVKLASDEAILTYFVSRLGGRTFCFRVEHDWEVEPDAMRTNIFAGSQRRTRAFIYCLRHADLVVCQTEKQKELLRKNYAVEAVIVSNGHRLPPREDLPDYEARRAILWIARAHPMKRPRLFLELARRLPEIPFTMVMAPDPTAPEFCQSIQAEAREIPNLTYIPGVPVAKAEELYKEARAFVLTSDAEGYANTVIEALKAGVPVLSLLLNFDRLLNPLPESPGYSPEAAQVVQPAGGFCCGGELEALVRLTRRLWSDPLFWEECSAQARSRARAEFDVESIAPRYVSMIRKLSRRA